MNTIETTERFDTWFLSLDDMRAKARIEARLDMAEDGNFGDCKPVRDGIFEMRIHIGAGYRIYCKQVGRAIYLLLAGGDKSSQSKDIKTALKLAQDLGV